MKEFRVPFALTVGIITPNDTVASQLETMLGNSTLTSKQGYSVNTFRLHKDAAPNGEDYHVVLLDEEAIDGDPTANLGALKLEFGQTPIIYLTNALKSPAALSAVKSLTSDYILKSNLSALSLQNCIRWVLHNTRLQLELEQQNRRYQSLFYNAVDPALILNADWIITNVNDAFTAVLGQESSSPEALCFSQLFQHEEDYERVKKWIESGHDNNVDCECVFKRLDRNSTFLGHLKISTLREYNWAEGRTDQVVAGFHASLSNISYRERIRNIKQRADRVDMTYRLARTLAHEIRNPLTNVNLALEQVAEYYTTDEKAENLLKLIGRSAGRINELIDQLLRASERSQINLDECALTDLLDEVLEEAKDRAHLVDIVLATDYEAKDLMYPCDSQKLKLAISNLMCNAIEAIEGGEGRIVLGTYIEDEYLCIYVEDNGKGMDEEIKQNLFDPFFTNKDKGLGLGLTATQTIVAEHEGEIEVESSPGYGSTFTISLPMRRSKRF